MSLQLHCSQECKKCSCHPEVSLPPEGLTEGTGASSLFQFAFNNQKENKEVHHLTCQALTSLPLSVLSS